MGLACFIIMLGCRTDTIDKERLNRSGNLQADTARQKKAASSLLAPRIEYAALAKRADKLREELPEEYTVIVQPPFVVIGDEASSIVRERSTATVKWAVSQLKSNFFEKDPSAIFEIWLFKDSQSYYRNAAERWGVRPDTPFGYASSFDRVLVMNISTGGGTLVHEIVHPFIDSNFADCPAWFNEGLASLYEQSAERDGKIVGLPNWRLEGLKKAILSNQLPSFHQLMTTTTDASTVN